MDKVPYSRMHYDHNLERCYVYMQRRETVYPDLSQWVNEEDKPTPVYDSKVATGGYVLGKYPQIMGVAADTHRNPESLGYTYPVWYCPSISVFVDIQTGSSWEKAMNKYYEQQSMDVELGEPIDEIIAEGDEIEEMT